MYAENLRIVERRALRKVMKTCLPSQLKKVNPARERKMIEREREGGTKVHVCARASVTPLFGIEQRKTLLACIHIVRHYVSYRA